MSVWVNLRQMRIAEQAIAQNKFGYLRIKDHQVIDAVLEEIHGNEKYLKVWKAIEEYANNLVENKCKPERDKLAEEMRPLGERANELSKEKASIEEGEAFPGEKETELKELNEKIAELNKQYQKVTDDANEELAKFKEEEMAKEQWAAFFMEEDEYEIMEKLTWWKAYAWATEK